MFITWYISITVTADAFTELVTLPEGWRPMGNMYFSVEVGGRAGRLFINPAGRVALYSVIGSNQSQGTVSFPLP